MIATLMLVFGALGIIGGIFGKDFRATDVITLHEFKDKKLPTWLGRVISIVAGVGLIAIGIKMLIEGR